MNPDGRDTTQLLNEAARGSDSAAREVFPLIYDELRRVAAAKVSKLPPGGTLQPTVLVHEAYLRIVGRNPAGWESVRHFYFAAARAMRDLLVEDARRKASEKHGGGRERVPIDELTLTLGGPPDDVLALAAALAKLERDDPEGHRLVLLRFFAGLPMPEVAGMLDVSLRTVERKWRFLRVWLARELEAPAP